MQVKKYLDRNSRGPWRALQASILLFASVFFGVGANAQYAEGYYPSPSELPTITNEEIGRIYVELYERAMGCIDEGGAGIAAGYITEDWCENYRAWMMNMRNELQYAVIKAGFPQEDADCINVLISNIDRSFHLAVFDNGGQSSSYMNKQDIEASTMHWAQEIEPCVERIFSTYREKNRLAGNCVTWHM